jgi:RNA recognition motif-containing protein
MNIYVGNLHYDVNEDELKALFMEYGEVISAKIIIDKYSGKSKGFGFVEMSNKEEGLKAIEELNGAEYKGRNMKVNPAEEKSGGGQKKFNKRPRTRNYNNNY